MFCPVCRDEYRPGFTHCQTCDAPLVASLDAAPERLPAPVVSEVAAEEATANFCGFLTLEEAREARDKVRAARLPAEILIRDAPKSAPDAPVQEEFWLRVRPADFRAIVALVGFEPFEAQGEDTFLCSACGATVHDSDEACPRCGLGFAE
jgi:rubrerythrin